MLFFFCGPSTLKHTSLFSSRQGSPSQCLLTRLAPTALTFRIPGMSRELYTHSLEPVLNAFCPESISFLIEFHRASALRSFFPPADLTVLRNS